MNKKILLLLSVLIVSAAWAGEPAVAPAADTAKTAPEAGVTVELKGTGDQVRALLAELEKSELYGADACYVSSAKTSKTTKVTCAKASGRLLDFLLANTPAKVSWQVSPAPMLKAICPPGCYMMPCPISYKCCRLTTHQPC